MLQNTNANTRVSRGTSQGYWVLAFQPLPLPTSTLTHDPSGVPHTPAVLYIHVIPYFSDYASLPGTITHGMWSSAVMRKFVENVVEGNPACIIAYAFLC